MKMNDNLTKIFDLEEVVPASAEETPLLPLSPSNEIQKEDDFELARATLRSLINKNEDVMTELVHIAKNSENPRAFEVAGQLITAQTAITKELVNLHKIKKDIDKVDGKSESIKQQNNIVFAGSTSDLMKLINGK